MKIKSLLSQKGLISQSPKAEEIIARAKSSGKPIKVFYGETYDAYGNTIDSMKYYFFVADLAKSLEQEGFRTDPIILIADAAACRNVSNDLQNRYMELGQSRADFVQKVNQVYGTKLRIIKMSDYIHTNEFQEERDKVMRICKSDSELMKKVEKTVPESKLDIERKKGFMYSFDEITTILDLDFKIGPPREDLYDNIAREIAGKLNKKGPLSIYLTPTFPVGLNFDYYISHPGIEDHGITAYKAGSKRLQTNRILVGQTTSKIAKELINGSFISTNRELPNPILDIGIISEMARRKLENDDSAITLYENFYSGKVTPEELKKKVHRGLEKNILSRF
jgi:hypothetical protein